MATPTQTYAMLKANKKYLSSKKKKLGSMNVKRALHYHFANIMESLLFNVLLTF